MSSPELPATVRRRDANSVVRTRISTTMLGELAEGDLVLLTSDAWDSRLIACFGHGISHVGMMLRFRGQLWYCHSYPSVIGRRSAVFTPDGVAMPANGVHGVHLESFVGTQGYRHAGVLRPNPPLSEAELQTIRSRFLALYGTPFERNSLQLLNACLGCGENYWCCTTDDSYFCSELIATLLMEVGRLPRDVDASSYTPNELRLALRHDHLGKLAGFKEPRPWWKTRTTRRISHWLKLRECCGCMLHWLLPRCLRRWMHQCMKNSIFCGCCMKETSQKEMVEFHAHEHKNRVLRELVLEHASFPRKHAPEDAAQPGSPAAANGALEVAQLPPAAAEELNAQIELTVEVDGVVAHDAAAAARAVPEAEPAATEHLAGGVSVV
jgi:hypothetical protein